MEKGFGSFIKMGKKNGKKSGKKIRASLIASIVLSLAVLSFVLIKGPELMSRLRKGLSAKVSSMMLLDEVEWAPRNATNLSGRVSAELFWKVSGLNTGEEILKINLSELEKKLLTIPWIESVEIQKKLPSTLVVNYTLHSARALVRRKNQLWLVSESGHWIAQLKQDLLKDGVMDLPVFTNENDLDTQFFWLGLFESEMGPEFRKLHEVRLLNPKEIEVFTELHYNSKPLKVIILANTRQDERGMIRLKKVAQYLIKNNILVSKIDLRSTKKVVVNVGKQP